jgi:RecB family exonuclease
MDMINQIINHPQLKSYYKEDDDLQIMNEQDIISTSGLMLRPDRLVINSQNEVVIIDYKTGDPNIQHADQLETYEAILTEMGYKVTSKLLIYINDKLEIKSA